MLLFHDLAPPLSENKYKVAIYYKLGVVFFGLKRCRLTEQVEIAEARLVADLS
jgi:hypothetical protein